MCEGRGTLLEDGHDLVDFGGEEVQGGHNAAVGAEVVLPHYFFVVDGVADVDVALEGYGPDCGIEVDDVGWLLLGVEVSVEALHEGGLAGAYGGGLVGISYSTVSEKAQAYQPCRCR